MSNIPQDVYFHPQIDGYPDAKELGYFVESDAVGDELIENIADAIEKAKANTAYEVGAQGSDEWEEAVFLRTEFNDQEEDEKILTVKFNGKTFTWEIIK